MGPVSVTHQAMPNMTHIALFDFGFKKVFSPFSVYCHILHLLDLQILDGCGISLEQNSCFFISGFCK